MINKWTFESVQTFIEEKGKILISNSYKNVHDSLKLRCITCLDEYQQSLHELKRGNVGCSCSKKGVKWTHDKVREYILKNGEILISESYKNAKTKLKIKCKICENEYNQSFESYKKGFYHKGCKDLSKKYIVDINNIQSKEIDNFIDKQSEYKRKNYSKIVKNNLKREEKCEKCGECKQELLEFAHYNRKDKNIEFGSAGVLKMKKEVLLGRFLCVWCHRLETETEIENLRKTQEDFIHIENTGDDDESYIKCNGELCKGARRHSSMFYDSDKWKTECKKCVCFYNCKRRKNVNNYVKLCKLAISECNICKIKVSYETACCFDFDHIDRSEKIANVSVLSKDHFFHKRL